MNKVAASQDEAGTGARIHLKLLGDVRFLRGADVDITPRSRRGRALVALLVLSRDYAAARVRLTELFWGDRGEVQARGSLRQCMLDVRAVTGEGFVVSGRDTVSLGGDWSSDVGAIDALLARQDAAATADALALAGRETLLGSFYVNESFNEWLVIARAEFDRRLADAARRGLVQAMANGDGDTARRIADTYLLRDPGDEDITVLAMQADAARGAAPIAHRRFQKLRDFLAGELGAAPGQAVLDALAALKTAPAAQPKPQSGPPLVIVGPFTEDGFAGDFQHIGSGVREDVVSGLSRFRDLRILVEDRIPAAAEAAMFGTSASAYALTAALRQTGKRLRVTPLLTRLSDRSVVWSNPMSLEVSDLETAIDTMVDRIIGAVTPRVERDAVPKVNAGAVYDRYLIAKHRAHCAENYAQAVEAAQLLEAIIAEAPDLAVAYPHLIRLYNTNYFYKIAGVDCTALRARAFELARTALAIDRDHAHSFTVMGWCQLWRGNWDAAAKHFEQSLDLNPYHAQHIKVAAFGLIFLGQHEASDRHLQRCLELDPLPNDNFFEDLGFLRLMQRRPDEAASYFALIDEPTVFAELYTVLAAKATGRPAADRGVANWRRRITSIWSAESAMTEDNLIRWLKQHLPFREPDHWRIFEAYLHAALR